MIRSKPTTREYREGWELTFREPEILSSGIHGIPQPCGCDACVRANRLKKIAEGWRRDG